MAIDIEDLKLERPDLVDSAWKYLLIPMSIGKMPTNYTNNWPYKLAAMLDPRYKDVAQPLQNLALLHAVNIARDQRFDFDTCARLLDEGGAQAAWSISWPVYQAMLKEHSHTADELM